jgi:competence protein ComEC
MTIACVSFLCGLGIAATGARLGWIWVIATLLLLPCVRKRRLLVAVPIVVAVGMAWGLARGGDMVQQLAGYRQYIGQKVSVTGTVAEDTTHSNDHQLVLLLGNVAINGQQLPGKIRVKSLAPVEPRRGDHIRVSGKLYDGFGNYQAAVYFAEIRIVTEVHNPIDVLRREFAARLYSLLPDTQAGLGLGFLLGIKASVPDTLSDQLKLLGLTHIVVASGYNLTILVRLARRLFASMSHYVMTLASGAMIVGFVTITGFSPSMSRAALVAGLCVLAWYYGRRIHPALLITLAAAITAAIHPLYVWSDIGWWLSFLAFAGVMLLAPLLQRRIFGKRKPKLLGQIVIETICAQITTLPLLLMIFGDLSVLSLVANVLVVPLIPIAMALTLVAGAIGWSLPVVAWPAIWLLTYMCQLVQLLSSVSWASVPLSISVPVCLLLYGLVALIGVVLFRKTKYDYLGSSMIE